MGVVERHFLCCSQLARPNPLSNRAPASMLAPQVFVAMLEQACCAGAVLVLCHSLGSLGTYKSDKAAVLVLRHLHYSCNSN